MISFNRYRLYSESGLKDGGEWGSTGKKFMVLESQLTTAVSKNLLFAFQVRLLQSNIRNMLNMVTEDVDLSKPLNYNWLQPIEQLHGRSFLQFFLASKEVINQLDDQTLINKF